MDLRAQIKAVTNGRVDVDEHMNPSEGLGVYRRLLDVIADVADSNVQGIEDILDITESQDVPGIVGSSGPFEQSKVEGLNNVELDKDLHRMQIQMTDFFDNDANWDANGFGYIPVEWLPEDF